MGKAVRPLSHHWNGEQLTVLYAHEVAFVLDHVQPDRYGRLWAEVVAKVGEDVVNQARLDLLDQRQRIDFHGAAHARDGQVDWQAHMVPVIALAQQGPGREEADKEPSPARTPTIVTLADVEPEPVQWLWDPYIPLGKLTLLEGDPGVGKTWLALAIAAHVSRGMPWPGSTTTAAPADVLYLTAEDGLADTLRPRLDAAGADVHRVHVLKGWTSATDQGGISLADIEVIEEAVRQTEARLLVIDPLQAFLGGHVDMHRANETRPLLAAVAAMAERCGCAVLIIRHLSKALQDRAIYRGLGSIDFAAAARSFLLAAQDPQHPSQRVLAHSKSSLAKVGPSLIYELREGQFLWGGPSELTAEALIRPYALEEERSATDEAQDFLRDVLAAGAKPATAVIQGARRAGIAERTLYRAKKGLVKARRDNTVGAFPGAG
ncbi:MAG: AAA family ATPase [Candidatus Entotheonellia bacterium]